MSKIYHPSGEAHWMHRDPQRVKRGTDSHAAKLTDAQIAEIRAIVSERPNVNKTALADQYGVSRTTIWRHVADLYRP